VFPVGKSKRSCSGTHGLGIGIRADSAGFSRTGLFPSTALASRDALLLFPPSLSPAKIFCLAWIMGETGWSGRNPSFDDNERYGNSRAISEQFPSELSEDSQSRDQSWFWATSLEFLLPGSFVPALHLNFFSANPTRVCLARLFPAGPLGTRLILESSSLVLLVGLPDQNQ